MKLEHKKFIFLGDSITEGYGTTGEEKIFHQIIKEKHNLSAAHNCGISGTRIAKQIHASIDHKYDLYFSLRVPIMPKDADAIVVFGGTNDFGHGDSEMGDINSTDIYTFYGGLNCLINNLKDNFPKAQLIFLTPLRRVTEVEPNQNGKILIDYVNAIIDVTKKYNLPVIDLFRSEIFDPNDTDVLPDGVHPNDKGHAIMADYIAKELLKI